MTRMSMRERHEKIDELVQQDPRVQNCANEFGNAQAHYRAVGRLIIARKILELIHTDPQEQES